MKALGTANNNPVIIRRYYIIMFSSTITISVLKTITGEPCENWVIIILKLLYACNNFAQTSSNFRGKPPNKLSGTQTSRPQ